MQKTDIAIFGGGIAGLWLLNLLISRGYSAVLLEKKALCEMEVRHTSSKMSRISCCDRTGSSRNELFILFAETLKKINKCDI